MKRIALVFALVLSFLTLGVHKQSAAEGEGPSVRGTFEISSDSGPSKYLEFYAKLEKNGSTTGETIFQSRPSPSDQKADIEDRTSTDSAAQFFAKAEFDCLSVSGNKAVMSGSVTESNSPQYVGRRVLLVVQDGDVFNPPRHDKLTFGIYRQTARGWLPVDSERPDEQGGPVAWIAQDSEREDDNPVLFPKSKTIACQSFPISSFSFIDERHGHGSIQVRQ